MTAFDLPWREYPEVVEHVRTSGFYHALNMGKFENINEIVTALVERWRPEYNCFHFPTGEHTISLEDVAYITGLPVDGRAVVEHLDVDTIQWCREWLTDVPYVAPRQRYGWTISITWLRRSMKNYLLDPANRTEDRVKRYTRSLLLLFLGGVLLTKKKGDKLHLMYLPLLADFESCAQYSWGAAVLSWLYRALFKAMARGCSKFDGCTHLLLGWFWMRWPTLAPIRHSVLPDDRHFPLIAR